MRLVLDWDGTCTEVDGLHMLLEEFGDRAVYDRMEGALGDGRLTLHEVIAREIATIDLTLPDAVEWLREHVTLRPGLERLIDGRDAVVVSSGFHELIEPDPRSRRASARRHRESPRHGVGTMEAGMARRAGVRRVR